MKIILLAATFSNALLVGFLAGIAATIAAFAIARVAAWLTNAPPSFAPFTFLPVASGGFASAIGASLIYCALALVFERPQTIFVVVAAILLLASFHLPFRLSNHRSPRFAGATFAMQLVLCSMHATVAAIGVGAALIFIG